MQQLEACDELIDSLSRYEINEGESLLMDISKDPCKIGHVVPAMRLLDDPRSLRKEPESQLLDLVAVSFEVFLRL